MLTDTSFEDVAPISPWAQYPHDRASRQELPGAPRNQLITVLIAHAVPLVSAGLMAVLGCEHDLSVALSTPEVKMDPGMGAHGFPFRVIIADPDTATRLLIHGGACDKRGERPKLLVVSSRDEAKNPPSLQSNADGCFVLDTAVSDLLKAVRILASGGRCCATDFASSSDTSRLAGRPCGGLAPGALKRVQTHVEQSLAEKIELADLAAIAKLSECHFSRAFKQSTGMPPHRYLMVRRVQAAAALIRETNRSLTEISLEVGFSDQSHFTRTFARAIGETPSAFRHRQR